MDDRYAVQPRTPPFFYVQVPPNFVAATREALAGADWVAEIQHHGMGHWVTVKRGAGFTLDEFEKMIDAIVQDIVCRDG